jgi:hypothetical protein
LLVLVLLLLLLLLPTRLRCKVMLAFQSTGCCALSLCSAPEVDVNAGRR